MPDILRRELQSSNIVMAIGVGGGGGNAVNHLYKYGEKEITYMLCNTDRQALNNSPISDKYKIQLGKDGLGAGNEASSGEKFAEESVDDIRNALQESGVKMAFVIAGMGGGTGTGAAPVVARIAMELGILTVGVVTIPFEEEGYHRINQAIAGVDKLSKHVDSLIIINSTHIVEMYGDLPLSQAFYKSNDIISKAVKSISDIINIHLLVNVDFADVCKVMRNSGVALMGTGLASGKDRALIATGQALTSPLLHNQDITGARSVLVCLISSHEHETKMSDVQNIPAYLQERTKTKNGTDLIWGAGYDDSLGEQMQVIVIATGFHVQNIPSMKAYYAKTLEAAEVAQKGESPSPEIQKPDSPNIVSLDDEEIPQPNQVSVDSEPQKPQVVENFADDEPFIVSASQKAEEDINGEPVQKHILLDDEPDPQPKVERPSDYSTEYEDEPQHVAQQPRKNPRGRGIIAAIGSFFSGALVDKDDRH